MTPLTARGTRLETTVGLTHGGDPSVGLGAPICAPRAGRFSAGPHMGSRERRSARAPRPAERPLQGGLFTHDGTSQGCAREEACAHHGQAPLELSEPEPPSGV
jgi:hypothetical protein